MSKRRELEEHLRVLDEIGSILSAMKNLALLETQKLTRLLTTQRRVIESIESAAADFLTFYPVDLGPYDTTARLFLLIGSERGFCGDFNETLVATYERHRRQGSVEKPLLITVGTKLSALLEEDQPVAARLEGAMVAEEVQDVMLRLTETLRELQAQQESFSPLNMTVFYHSPDSQSLPIQTRQPFQALRRRPIRFSYPPILNLDPRALAVDLVDHYLFAALHAVFYSSLMAENQRRFQQMDHALQHLERTTAELKVRRNIMRQEEITEEIEVILLSAEALARPR